MNLNEMSQEAYYNSRNHGFWGSHKQGEKLSIETIGLKLALIHSEVSEALEEARKNNLNSRTFHKLDGSEKPIGFPSELADILIRVGDLAYAMGINLDYEVKRKMAYNEGRPSMHGKLA